MNSSKPYEQPASTASHGVKEEQIEYGFIGKLQGPALPKLRFPD